MTTQPEIERLLRQAIGLNPDSIGWPAIQSAVRARIEAREAGSPEEYWSLLQNSPGELQALIESVVVSETWFFRDGAPFAEFARAAAAVKNGGGVLRMLSLPCATGEEPYSLAMALMDQGMAPARFQIDAMDISERALAQARRAIYSRNAFRAQDLGFRDRYFRPVAEGHLLADIVRERVTFRHGNLLTDHLAAGVYDFIFCRNLLIYLDEAARERAAGNLHRALTPEGLLFVGHAELPVVTPHGFASADLPGAFACCKRTAAKEPGRPRPLEPKSPARTSPPLPHRTAPPRHASPSRRLAATPAAPVAPAPVSLEEAKRLADQGRLREAAELCTAHLKQHGSSVLAHYLLGLTHDAAGEDQLAAEQYRKALYLDPAHGEALQHLGYLLEKQGDAEGARRLRVRASRAQPAAQIPATSARWQSPAGLRKLSRPLGGKAR